MSGVRLCECGHAERDHIYEEGACRPGFACADGCTVYRPVVPRVLDTVMPAADPSGRIGELEREVARLQRRLKDRADIPREMREAGLLWALNRHAFHPRGFALAFDVDDSGHVTGWKVFGDGNEPWSYPDDDHDEFQAFESLLDRFRSAD